MKSLFRQVTIGFLLLGLAGATGCRTFRSHGVDLPTAAPRELNKAVLPDYVIEPPDLLTIDALTVVPREPYKMRTGDAVAIQLVLTAGIGGDGAPIFPNLSDTFAIGFGGVVDLGVPYGQIKLAGLTAPQAEFVIREMLKNIIKAEFIQLVSVSVVAPAGTQQVQGEHLVGPDGTINLGLYGKVAVVGMTVPQARQAVERHLSQYLQDPKVAVDVFSYNSKVYYVITGGAGLGDTVTRFPVMGNETVLDAVSNVGGLSDISSKRMWIARPGLNQHGQPQILPVDYCAMTQLGDTATNYQLLPGDRLFIAGDKRVFVDSDIAKWIAPLERVMGFTLLGTNVTSRLSGPVLRGGGARGLFGVNNNVGP